MSLTIKELCVDLQKTGILKNINLEIERENLFRFLAPQAAERQHC